ncbi:hypothetical protein NLJ89_g9370 [Agrocybe chaxingu]|uniref:Uncharacterized protein n=1 Tax=Agrocybe chaxingu TaxID=84603 RepID=A0A9W8MRA7_9AGAR|nr:hypothetical protein NLJ89_g9370 [Agrocybe chaxingu]
MDGGNNSNDDPVQEIQVPPRLILNGMDTDGEEPTQWQERRCAPGTLVMLPAANLHTPRDMTSSVKETSIEVDIPMRSLLSVTFCLLVTQNLIMLAIALDITSP